MTVRKYQLVIWPIMSKATWRPPISVGRHASWERVGLGSIYASWFRIGPFDWRRWRDDVEHGSQPALRKLADGVCLD